MWLLLLTWIVSVKGRYLVGEYMAQRDSLGNLLPKQCHGSTGFCWCIDKDGGRVSLTGPGIHLNCPKLLDPARAAI